MAGGEGLEEAEGVKVIIWLSVRGRSRRRRRRRSVRVVGMCIETVHH